MFELRHEASAQVSPLDQEVRDESHAADHVSLASLSLPLLHDDPLALQDVELDLALVPHGAVVSVELHVRHCAQVLTVSQQVHVGLAQQVEPGPVVHPQGQVERSQGQEGGLDVGGHSDAGAGLQGAGHGDLHQGGEVSHPRQTGGAQKRQLGEIDRRGFKSQSYRE